MPVNVKWDEAFLVGGGPSLRGFNFNKLRGRTVVAINDVLLHLPFEPTALFSADRDWIHARRDEIRNFKGERFLAVCLAEPYSIIPGVTYLDKRYDPGLSEDPAGVHVRGNSGYAAVNLAYLAGCQRIVLLGYDYNNCNGHMRWYDGGMQSGADGWILEQWAAEFTGMKKQLQYNHVRVINCSLISRITAFPKQEFSNVLEL